MDILSLVERIGEAPAAALFGLITGVIFGVAAQRSRFCLRAATVEFARGQLGERVAVWLLCFSTALIWVQAAEQNRSISPNTTSIVPMIADTSASWSP